MLRLLPLAFLTAAALGQSNPMLGNWSEPGGSTIEIYRCDDALCLRLAGISPKAPATTDIHNPDASLRTRPLCGLVIGQGFHISGNTADGGELYDPKSGKTYRGAITHEGDTLHLRGYLGIKLFGRTETWTRTGPGFQRCYTA